ncbi:NUDIX hydrolase [Sphingomonas nostoxanthinifaciens]|uniref:NUDIX hydrolase n=1 Tax=Sphingomonas nostoxanthinifaciens TaxID=2872652 RepID=UPI001CC1E1B2|nr:NUDIX hydrolase [Sphingomonas nostoxanthinifaciens]
MLQSAAIPYRIDDAGGVSLLLIRSRTRRRWIIPKGKIGARLLPSRSAEREAFEEAGVLGRIGHEPIGSYRQPAGNRAPLGESLLVQAYPLEVVDELSVWQEMHQRERRWFTVKEALRAVTDPEIKTLIRIFGSYARGLREAGPTGVAKVPPV